MTDFTPISASIGGALIGLSAVMLLWTNGRIAGISGILNGAIRGDDRAWRWWFLGGLIAGCAIWALAGGIDFPEREGFPLSLLIGGGLLVGFGTRLGSGCTSGHGICGIGRLSNRSIIATITFLVCGMITVFVVRHVLGWTS